MFSDDESFFKRFFWVAIIVNIAWIGFLMWAIYTLVTYFTS